MKRRFSFPLLALAILTLLVGAVGASPITGTKDKGDLPTGELTYPVGTDGGITIQSHNAYCTIFAGDPYYVDAEMDVEGWGWQQCYGSYTQTKMTVTLQKHWFLGWWNNLDQQLAPSGGGWGTDGYYSRTAVANCVSGTNTYRIVTDGWFRDAEGEYHGTVYSGQNFQKTC